MRDPLLSDNLLEIQNSSLSPNSEEVILTSREVAILFRLSLVTINTDRLTGKMGIPFFRLGRAVRYRKSAIMKFLDEQPSFVSTSQGQ